MKVHATLLGLLLVLLISGCANLQTGLDFQAGRNALLTGNTAGALPYFQGVAEKDPGYFYSTAYHEGVLGFLGRTQYTLGQLPLAQKTLERAVAQNPNDLSARLYLGLTLARLDDRQRGL